MPATVTLQEVVNCDDFIMRTDSETMEKTSMIEIDWHPGREDHQALRLTGECKDRLINTFLNAPVPPGIIVACIFHGGSFRDVMESTPGFARIV